MAFTNQVFVPEAAELNPVGPGDNYTATTFIDHLVAWFTTNTGGWLLSASGTNYVELKPAAAGAINSADRVLFWGGVSPNAAALANGQTASTTSIYCCYAPNAGTTGPDALPSAGIPYTGVISSLLITVSVTETVQDTLQIFQSKDVLRVYHRADASKSGVGVCMVGRFFNPVGTADQLPAMAGHGEAFSPSWSEVALTGGSSEWNCDPVPGSTDTTMFAQETVGDVDWTMLHRSNGWVANGFKKLNLSDGNFFKVELHRTNNDPNESEVLVGWPLFALGGPAALHGTIIADGGGDIGYAQSYSTLTATGATWYLMDEALA